MGLAPAPPIPTLTTRRTYARCTTGFARPRLPVGNPPIGHSLQEHTTQKEIEMFNKNGSNNGNGSANGVHKDTGHKPARNGNGHKPDAAIVSEHELLWDGLSPAVTRRSDSPSTPRWPPSARARRAQLRLPRRPRRHRPGQPHLRIRRVGLRVGRRCDAAPDRDGRYPQTGEVKVASGLQRPGAGHRRGRAAPHRHRRPPGGRGHPGRPRCAASRGIGYPTHSGGTRRESLGQPTYLAAKAKGDNSMSVKRLRSESVVRPVPQDPRDMVKAALLEPQSPVGASRHPPVERL